MFELFKPCRWWLVLRGMFEAQWLQELALCFDLKIQWSKSRDLASRERVNLATFRSLRQSPTLKSLITQNLVNTDFQQQPRRKTILFIGFFVSLLIQENSGRRKLGKPIIYLIFCFCFFFHDPAYCRSALGEEIMGEAHGTGYQF